ncbi:MAG: hypothetical protein LBS74_02915 [Oscillospiraceae bacterium]|jgi:hypothetical protein|nr:hypothetical protein [Oscillospiraceae bacterium]
MQKPYSNKRWHDNPCPIFDLQCNKCKNYFGFGKCKAFPEKIPPELLSDEIKHNKPYPNDNGIVFEPKK